MVTNVTTVFVTTGVNAVFTPTSSIPQPQKSTSVDIPSSDAGKFILMNVDHDGAKGVYEPSSASESFKIGYITKKNSATLTTDANGIKKVEYTPIIKWSNEIPVGKIRNYEVHTYSSADADTEDKAEITFSPNTTATFPGADQPTTKRILVRITYKDMTTRYRKWTETYEYIAAPNESGADIAKGIAKVFSNNYKRNRVNVTLSGAKLTIEAMKYDDDNGPVDTNINVANKVRFSVNVYYTEPQATGWAAKNKYAWPDAVTFTTGKQYQASAKLVRDREYWAMGYDGIFNRGEGTWPIIKPEMNVDLSKNYDYVTIEWERDYRAADDIVRKTRETVEIYTPAGTGTAIVAKLNAIINDNPEPQTTNATEA